MPLLRRVMRSWWGRAGVVVAAVTAVLAVVLPSPDQEAIEPVSLTSTVAQARQHAPYAMWVPRGLSEAWKPTHASVDRLKDGAVEVHFDYLAPGGGHAGVVSQNTNLYSFVNRTTGGATQIGFTDIGDYTWLRMGGASNNPNRISLLLYRADGVVVVVSGTISWPLLTQLAASLQPVSG